MLRPTHIILATSLALLYPGSVWADGFAGLECKYLDGTPTLNPYVTALNGSMERRAVVCDANPADAPLGLDVPTKGKVTQVEVPLVQVIDNNPTEDLQSQSVSSTGVGTLNIGDPAVLQLTPAQPEARAMLLCFVPGMFNGQPSGLLSLFATSDFSS